MKKLFPFLGVVVLFLICFASFSFSSPLVKWQPSETGGSFVVGEDTKSIPNIDKMYVATGATIYFNFHVRARDYFFPGGVETKQLYLISCAQGDCFNFYSLNMLGFIISR